jgi:hypothetical protein
VVLNLLDLEKPKQAPINAFYYVCKPFWGLRPQSYYNFFNCARRALTKFTIFKNIGRFFCVYPIFLVILHRNKPKRKIKEMENRRFEGKNEPEIVYSRSVKAGKRIYYLDVKKARNEDLYLCITESKRKQTGEAEPPQFEKHKVFLYKEDFAHFTEGLNDVISFVQSQLGAIEERKEWTPESEEPIAPQESESAAEDKSLLGTLLNKLKN